jgi:hypothetical protein
MKKTNFTSKDVTGINGLAIIILITLATIFSQGNVYGQEFQTKKVADKITIISNPDIGDQVSTAFGQKKQQDFLRRKFQKHWLVMILLM